MSASAPAGTGPWDFSHILEFHNNSLNSSNRPVTSKEPLPKSLHATVDHKTRAANSASPLDTANASNQGAVTNRGVALGDFTKVWQLLGTPAPTPQTPRSGARYSRPPTPKDDYASDSGNYLFDTSSSPKRKQSPNKETDYDLSADCTDGKASALTKTQRKKQNRKARKEKEKEKNEQLKKELLQNTTSVEPVERPAVVKSDNTTTAVKDVLGQTGAEIAAKAAQSTPVDPISAWQNAATALPQQYTAAAKAANEKRKMDAPKPAQIERTFKETFKKTSANQGVLGAPRKYDFTEYTIHDGTGSRAVSTLEPIKTAGVPPHLASKQHEKKSRITPPTTDDEETTAQAVNAVQQAMASMQRLGSTATPSPNTGMPRTKIAPVTPGKQGKQNIAQTQPAQKMKNFTTPKQLKNLELLPSSVGALPPKTRNAFQQELALAASPGKTPGTPMVAGPKPKQPMAIEPLIQRSEDERNLALLVKLMNTFATDRKHLLSPMNMTTHNQDPKGIHVFVDASNIFIGFMDQLKQARGIHPLAHMPQAHLSFDGLALLMERRRPVAKRVLAGSNPWLPAFDTAKNVGYEMCILDKVHKARELTQRQIYFKEQDAKRFGKGSKAPAVHNALIKQPTSPTAKYSVLGNIGGSGTETSTPQFAPAKMIEQGVDEILHLKITLSLLDYEEPSTIVLATGDAALAEYSDGFMAMVERALRKGWTVELLSWSRNISRTYLKSDWVNSWDGRFKIIYLDDFAEELLCM